MLCRAPVLVVVLFSSGVVGSKVQPLKTLLADRTDVQLLLCFLSQFPQRMHESQSAKFLCTSVQQCIGNSLGQIFLYEASD